MERSVAKAKVFSNLHYTIPPQGTPVSPQSPADTRFALSIFRSPAIHGPWSTTKPPVLLYKFAFLRLDTPPCLHSNITSFLSGIETLSAREMGLKRILALVLAIACLTGAGVAAPQLEIRAGSVCSSGVYGELVPLLAQYPIALSFCSAVYPIQCTSAKLGKRASTTTVTPSSTTTKASTTITTKASTTKTTTTTTQNAQSSAWSKCQQQPANVVSTICSCIETPKVSRAKRIPVVAQILRKTDNK
jgi:hypothetical protein